MASSDVLGRIAPFLEPKQAEYIELLKKFIAFPGISQQPTKRKELVESCDWLADQLRQRKGQVQLHPMGQQPGETDPKTGGPIDLPPVITAAFGDPSGPVLLAYCHYDVQPALKSDGWDTEPFVLTERDCKGVRNMYGRGVTDDKGPILCWLWALDALAAAGEALPVRLVLCFEGFEEHGSLGLPEWVEQHVKPRGAGQEGCPADGMLSPANPLRPDYVVITDSYWLAPNQPCVTYALRGNCYFHAKVEGPASDLHSGVHGGPTFEPMVDLTHLLASLVTPAGAIQVAGLEDDVKALTDLEKSALDKTLFDPDVYAQAMGYKDRSGLRNNGDKVATLLARWRKPTLSIHGVEGAFYEPGAKTVIPGTVIGKFSIRTVANMEPSRVEAAVQAHCAKVWAQLGSPNKMTVRMSKAGPYFYEDPTAVAFQAAIEATKHVWSKTPDLTCEGCSIPIASAFKDAAQTSVVLLPLGAFDDNAHAQNEKFSVEMYTKGPATVASFMFELAALHKAK